MYITRSLEQTILKRLNTSEKGIVLYGARQVGKTTLVEKIIERLGYQAFKIDGDQTRYVDVISSRNWDKIKSLVGKHKLLFIDEAQRIPEIGINLKIILDNMSDLKVIVTGSSALNLASEIAEPLTGKVWTYKLYPVSQLELAQQSSWEEEKDKLEERLRFGTYPEMFSYESDKDREEYVRGIADKYLYKDILQVAGLKNAGKIHNILKLLAFQIGAQVSMNELGSSLDMSKETVGKYIELLEKSFIIFRLGGFSRNLRKEVVKKPKFYFYDLGVRNVFADNFNYLTNRNDVGQLWENFLIVERLKSLAYTEQYASRYFWRTYTGAEVDYVEEKNGQLSGYEIKWQKDKSRNLGLWQGYYPASKGLVVNKNNYREFLSVDL